MKKKTTKQFIDEAILLHSGRYIYLKTIYSNAHDKVIITCQIHGDFKQTPRNHLFGRNGKGQGCHKCMLIEKADNIRLTNEEIDQYLIDNDITIKRIGNYINSAIHLNWKCLLCDNVWSSVPNSIRQGIGCPKCNDTKLNNKDIDDYIFIHTLQLKRIDDYINIYTKINWQCLVCNYIWLAQPCEIKRKGLCRDGSGCPECSRGKNEKRVGEVLNLLNIQHRKIRINLPTGQKIFPDFFLPQLNTIIEYNGVQHYKPTCFGSQSRLIAEKSFARQQSRDILLRLYCQKNNISLLEIDGRQYKGENLKSFVLSYFKSGDSYV